MFMSKVAVGQKKQDVKPRSSRSLWDWPASIVTRAENAYNVIRGIS